MTVNLSSEIMYLFVGDIPLKRLYSNTGALLWELVFIYDKTYVDGYVTNYIYSSPAIANKPVWYRKIYNYVY